MGVHQLNGDVHVGHDADDQLSAARSSANHASVK